MRKQFIRIDSYKTVNPHIEHTKRLARCTGKIKQISQKGYKLFAYRYDRYGKR